MFVVHLLIPVTVVHLCTPTTVVPYARLLLSSLLTLLLSTNSHYCDYLLNPIICCPSAHSHYCCLLAHSHYCFLLAHITVIHLLNSLLLFSYPIQLMFTVILFTLAVAIIFSFCSSDNNMSSAFGVIEALYIFLV